MMWTFDQSGVAEQDRLLIILNGPPRAGKDHIATMIADEISELGCDVIRLSISDRVKEVAHELYGVNCDIDAFEDVKDLPNTVFRGLTPRQTYINVSTWIRRDLGPEYLGRAALKRIGDYRGTVLLPGAGFRDELEPLIKEFGPVNTLLLRLEGGAWDSRSRLDIPEVAAVDIARNAFAEAAFLIANYAVEESLERRRLMLPARIEAAPRPCLTSIEL